MWGWENWLSWAACININYSERRFFFWGVPACDWEHDLFFFFLFCYLPVRTFRYTWTDVNLFRYGMPREKFHTVLAIHSPSTKGVGWGSFEPAPFLQFFSQNAQRTCDLPVFWSRWQWLLPMQMVQYAIWHDQINIISKPYKTALLLDWQWQLVS